MSRSFELPEVEWATVGTVGPPGQRTFYLQARQDDQMVTLKLEKQQVAAIAQFLGEILSDLPVPDPLPDDEPGPGGAGAGRVGGRRPAAGLRQRRGPHRDAGRGDRRRRRPTMTPTAGEEIGGEEIRGRRPAEPD